MLINIQIFFIILACCVAGLLYYQKVALRNAITSSPNFRTLHHGDKVTGGGITFSMIFVCVAFFFWLTKHISDEIFFILGVGGFFATFLGFLDDLYSITAIKKLSCHILLAMWSIYWLKVGLFSDIEWLPNDYQSLYTLLPG